MCKNKDLLFKEHTTVSTTSWCFWQESQKEQIGSAKLHSALTVWLRCCGGYDRCWNSTSNLNKTHQAQSLGWTFPPLKMICSLRGVRMLGWWLYMYREERGVGGVSKGRLRQGGENFPWNDEVPNSIRQICGTGSMLFNFHEIIQKWIIAWAQEALEIHRASREQINSFTACAYVKIRRKIFKGDKGLMFGSSFLHQIFTYLWHCFQICWALLALADFTYCAQHFWEARQMEREVFRSRTRGSDIQGRHVQCWCLGDSISEPVPSMPLAEDEFSLYIQWVLVSHTRFPSTS